MVEAAILGPWLAVVLVWVVLVASGLAQSDRPSGQTSLSNRELDLIAGLALAAAALSAVEVLVALALRWRRRPQRPE
jgi:hypothetical protein